MPLLRGASRCFVSWLFGTRQPAHRSRFSVTLMMERLAEAYHATPNDENGFLVLTFRCLAFRLPA
jgi:hypothetical protein